MPKVYVTVSAYDQFAQDIIVGPDREKAFVDAFEAARKKGWAFEDEKIYPDNVATPGHSALIYHVQREADRCEDYISVFEVIPEDNWPSDIFDLGIELEDTIGKDADTLTVKQIDVELEIHRRTLASGKAADRGNIHVRIGDLERARVAKVAEKVKRGQQT